MPSSSEALSIRIGMKKLAIIAGIIMVSATAIPAQADTKSLVIVDSYFDSRVSGLNVSCVTLQDLPCTDVVAPKYITSSPSSNVNHGNAMAEVAKRQGNIPLILLRSAPATKTSVSDVNAGNFIEALRWVEKNSAKVGAVSLSRYFNGKSTCSPASTNTATYGGITKADETIRQLIVQLKNKGIPVFASTGNTMGKPIDYPACILDANSVSTAIGGKPYSVGNFDSNTDYFGNLPANTFNYKSAVFGSIPQTSSSATVATAAKYLLNIVDNRFVNVLQ